LPQEVAGPQYGVIVALLRAEIEAVVPGLSVHALRRGRQWQLRVEPNVGAVRGDHRRVPASQRWGVDVRVVKRIAEAHGGRVWCSGSARDRPAVWVLFGDAAAVGP
jgi:hypothetical protein